MSPGHQGKLKLFQQLMRAHGFLPEEMLVVGDNPDSEIDAGNKLGMKTIQILRPVSHRPTRQLTGFARSRN